MFSAPDPKQRLQLSDAAWAVIENDMFAFHQKTVPRFINHIFRQYYRQADASIGLRLERRREELRGVLPKEALERLLDAETERWLKALPTYERSERCSFSLSQENMTYLSEECGEDVYYNDRRGAYFAAVIEEYARLPYVERELLYLHDHCEQIQRAIRSKSKLKATTDRGTVYMVSPHPTRPIRQNPEGTSNYLVGYRRTEEDTLAPCCFKLSALAKLNNTSSPGTCCEKEWTELERLIRVRGVQFLVSPEETVRVRFTDEGLRRYRRNLTMRPTALTMQDHIGEFLCSPVQAEYYFIKYGADAEILDPPALRERFAAIYQAAAKRYE